MEQTDTLAFAAGGLISGIAYLIVIIACIMLVVKQKSASTILMLVSQIASLFLFVGSFFWRTFSAHESAESLVRTTKILALIGPLPQILFAVGLLWYVLERPKS